MTIDDALIEGCTSADGCKALEQAIKAAGLWRAYATALTGDDRRPAGVAEANEVLWGWSWGARRIAIRRILAQQTGAL